MQYEYKPKKSDPGKPIVLAVDDSIMLLKVYERIFITTQELKGFWLVRQAGARMALDWLEKNPGKKPVAIFLDWMMEGMSGLDMLINLKADPRWKDIPIIMATSNGEHSGVMEAVGKGAADYIVKPLQSHVLSAKLIKIISGKPPPA